MKSLCLLAAATAVVMLAGCTTSGDFDPPAGQKAKITRQTMGYFTDAYKPIIGTTRPGAFAVSLSGRNSYYTYCNDIVCMSGFSYTQRAMQGCEHFGEKCYLFAVGDKIRVDYDVVN